MKISSAFRGRKKRWEDEIENGYLFGINDSRRRMLLYWGESGVQQRKFFQTGRCIALSCTSREQQGTVDVPELPQPALHVGRWLLEDGYDICMD